MNAAFAITLTLAIVYAAGVVTGYRFAHWQVWAWLLLPGVLCAHDAPELTVEESVDEMHRNHFYDEQGRLVFEQVIFSTWCPNAERRQVVAWRLIKNPDQLPERDWEHGGYSATWLDGEVMRRVRSVSYQESWTQVDVELLEREWLPKEMRRELRINRIEKVSARPLPPPSGPASGR